MDFQPRNAPHDNAPLGIESGPLSGPFLPDTFFSLLHKPQREFVIYAKVTFLINQFQVIYEFAKRPC